LKNWLYPCRKRGDIPLKSRAGGVNLSIKGLIFKNKTIDIAAKTVIECLRATILFVKQELGDYNGVNEIEDKEQIDNLETPSMPLIAEKTAKVGGTTWNFPLLGKTASVSIVGGEPLQEDVDLLTKLLEAFKEGLNKKKVENNE
jgi:hypothetical protein